MLEFKDVSVRLGGQRILDGVSFSLRPGCVTALVGRNGSGKSTLLSCVDGLVPWEGQILLEGKPLRQLPPRQRSRRVAIAHQELPVPRITGRELVSFGREPHLDLTGRLREADRRAVEEALRAVEAEDLALRRVDTLSGGERQRLALAMLLALQTPLLLLDEPTAHLDLGWQAELLRLLTELEGKTVLAVLHDIGLAVRYAEELLVLEEGRLVFAGSREECLRQQILEKTFRLRRYSVDGRYFFAPD